MNPCTLLYFYVFNVELSKLQWKCLENGPRVINLEFTLIFVPQSLESPLKMVEKKRSVPSFVGFDK